MEQAGKDHLKAGVSTVGIFCLDRPPILSNYRRKDPQ